MNSEMQRLAMTLAETYTRENVHIELLRPEIFLDGFTAAIETLSKGLPAFDSDEADVAATDCTIKQCQFVPGARWQHEQDAILMAAAIQEGRRLARESMSCREIHLQARLEETTEDLQNTINKIRPTYREKELLKELLLLKKQLTGTNELSDEKCRHFLERAEKAEADVETCNKYIAELEDKLGFIK